MGPKVSSGLVEVKAHRHVLGEDRKRHCTMPEAHRPKTLKPKQPKQPKTTSRKKRKLRNEEEGVSVSSEEDGLKSSKP